MSQLSKEALVLVDHEMKLWWMLKSGECKYIGGLVYDGEFWEVYFSKDVCVGLQVIYELEGILREYNRVTDGVK